MQPSLRPPAAWRHHPFAARVLVVLFCTGLVLPGGLALIGAGDPDAVAFEFRRPAPAPQWNRSVASWRAFPRGFESYFGDRYALRSELLSLRARLHWNLLGSSPSPLVVRGKDDWIFLTASHALPNAAGKVPMTFAEVDNFLAAAKRRRDLLAQRGIHYLFAFVPEKSSVYPEFLPWNHVRKGQRRVDQIMERAAELGLDFVLDTTDAVVAAKDVDGVREDDYTFFPLGTHWTSRGAAAAGRAIADRWAAAGLPARLPDPSELRFDHVPNGISDLWDTRLYLVGAVGQETYEGIWSRGRAAEPGESIEAARAAMWRRPGAPAKKLLVFHDSNGPAVQPTLATAFQESRWEWRRYEQQSVEEFEPEAVLELFSERHLLMSLPYQDDPAAQPDLARLFAQAEPPALAVEPSDWSERLEPENGARLLLDAPGYPGLAVLVFEGREGYFRLQLPELETGRDWILRLDCAARSDGAVGVTYTWRSAGDVYPIESNHAQRFSLASGNQSVYIHLSHQRVGTEVGLSTGGTPRALRIDRLEARALPHR